MYVLLLCLYAFLGLNYFRKKKHKKKTKKTEYYCSIAGNLEFFFRLGFLLFAIMTAWFNIARDSTFIIDMVLNPAVWAEIGDIICDINNVWIDRSGVATRRTRFSRIATWLPSAIVFLFLFLSALLVFVPPSFCLQLPSALSPEMIYSNITLREGGTKK